MHGHHGHPHDHDHRREGGSAAGGGRTGARRRLRLTLVLTAGVCIAELVTGLATGSLALVSDAGHMLSDVGALLISYFAVLVAQRPADPRKSYGYHRAEILGALGNAVALLVLTAFIAYEAAHRLLEPRPVDAGPMVLVALLGLAANGAALFVLRPASRNLNIRAAFLHVVGDTVSSLGVVLCGLAMLAGAPTFLDALVSLFIAVMIVVSALQVLREAVDVLLEATPAHIDAAAVAEACAAVDGVREVHDLHVWSITSGMPALSAHAIVDPSRLPESQRILDDLKHVLLERFGIDHTTIQIEPEGYEHVGEIHETTLAVR